MQEERRFSIAPKVDSSVIPKDEATQKLIRSLAQQVFDERVFFGIPGSPLSDWVEAEKKYIRTFIRRRNDDII